MINKAYLVGNLTRDAELRSTSSGTSVLSFGLAVNEKIPNKQTGQYEDYPHYFDCVMFGKRAEKLAQYLTKGTKATIEGKLRYSVWERDGVKRSKIEVIVNEIEFMTKRNTNQSDNEQPVYGYVPDASPVEFYEDVPF